MAEADVVVFVVDGREGIHALDREVAELLRRHDKPVVVAVNKVDSPSPDQEMAVYEFFELGLGDPIRFRRSTAVTPASCSTGV